MMKKLLLSTAYASGFMVISAAFSQAATINWGASFNPNDFFSDGSAIANSGTAVTFELGAFATGFTPTAGNVNDWAANWTVIDSSGYNSVDLGGGVTGGNFGGSVEQSNFDNPISGSAVTAGQDVYVWAFTQKAVDTTTEWALFGAQDAAATGPAVDNWVVPSGPANQGQPAIDWEPLAATPVFGATSGATGAGIVDSPQTLTDNQIQLYQVIPEPSSTLLIVLGGLTLLRRKR